MFTGDDILARTRRQPFQPFRILTTTGQIYDVHHPDQAAASRRAVSVPATPTSYGLPDQTITIALIHIVEIHDLVSAPPAASNGQA